MSLFRVVIPSILLIGSFAMGALVLWPNYQEFSDLRTQVQEREERLARGEAALNRLKGIQEEVEAHQKDFEKIDKAIPQETQLPAVYDAIQDLGSSSGVVVQAIEASVSTLASEEQRVAGVTLKVELLGTYEGLKNFLSNARSFARILNAQSLAIRDAAIVDDSGEVTPGLLGIEVEFEAYSYENN